MNIVPAIDLRGGKCVRLLQGDFARQTNYRKDPVTLVRDYEAMGATEIHIVDLDGARHGSQRNQETISAMLSNTTCSVQLGGGLRRIADIESWLGAGLQRLVIGSLAIENPPLIIEWLQQFGPEIS